MAPAASARLAAPTDLATSCGGAVGLYHTPCSDLSGALNAALGARCAVRGSAVGPPEGSQQIGQQRLLRGEVHADLGAEGLEAVAEELGGLAPRLGGRPRRRVAQLLHQPRLEPRDREQLELDRAVVREQLRAVLAVELARGRGEPVGVDGDLDGVLLGHEGAPRREEAEEGAHAPRLGQVAKVLRLDRALHLEHVAPQRLVRDEQELGGPVEGAALLLLVAQHRRRQAHAGDQRVEVAALAQHVHLEQVLVLEDGALVLERAGAHGDDAEHVDAKLGRRNRRPDRLLERRRRLGHVGERRARAPPEAQ